MAWLEGMNIGGLVEVADLVHAYMVWLQGMATRHEGSGVRWRGNGMSEAQARGSQEHAREDQGRCD